MNYAGLCLMACAVAAVFLDPPTGARIDAQTDRNPTRIEAAWNGGPKEAAPQKAPNRDLSEWEATNKKTGEGDWQAADERIPQDALEAGNEDGLLLYSCRGAHMGGMQLGRVRADFHGCHIGYGGREVEVAPYEVLAATWMEASYGETPAGAAPAGASPALAADAPFRVTLLAPCRAAWRGALQVGEVRDGGCVFGFAGQQVMVDRYEVLVASPWMTWAPAVPLALDGIAIAGGSENGDKLYVCRAAAGGGLHVGKIKRSALGCSVTDGRREVVAKRFELLIPRWRTGTEDSLPVSALPQGRENGASQYLCRAQRSNTVQIGRVSENQAGCHIGMQGSEAVATVYDVLGQ
jgi:hypothetical protein